MIVSFGFKKELKHIHIESLKNINRSKYSEANLMNRSYFEKNFVKSSLKG